MRSSRNAALLVSALAAMVLGGEALAVGEGAAPPAPDPAEPVLLDIVVPGRTGTLDPSSLAFRGDQWKGLSGWVSPVGSGRVLTPAVDGGRVYAGSGLDMNCYNAMGGKRGWSTKVDDSAPSAPAVADGHVYFNTQSCTLYDVDAITGRRVWSRWVAGSVNTTPAVAGGLVYVSGPDKGTPGCKLEAYDAKSGELVFRTHIPSDVISAPVSDGARVYYALVDGTLAAATREGKALWESDVKAVSAPVPVGARLLVATAGEKGAMGLLDVDALTGTPGGRNVATPAPAPNPPGEPPSAPPVPEKQGMAGPDIGNRGGGGAAPGPKAGPTAGPSAQPKEPLRDRPNGPGKGGRSGGGTDPDATGAAGSNPPPRPGFPGLGGFGYEGPRPVVSGRVVALACSDHLLLRDLDGGGEKRVPVGDGAAGSPAAAGGFLVQATTGGRVLLVEAASGIVRYEMRFRTVSGDEVPFSSSPSVSRGRLYIGTADGRLMGVDLPDPALDGWPMWGGAPGRAR